ncbi:MAG: hypothetical protein ACPGVF_08735, partial [Flavobacteriaceae bacterium]
DKIYVKISKNGDSTKYHLDKAEVLFKALGDLDNYGLMVLRIGGIYYAKGNYNKALSKAFEAADIFKKTNKKKGESPFFDLIMWPITYRYL